MTSVTDWGSVLACRTHCILFFPKHVSAHICALVCVCACERAGVCVCALVSACVFAELCAHLAIPQVMCYCKRDIVLLQHATPNSFTKYTV